MLCPVAEEAKEFKRDSIEGFLGDGPKEVERNRGMTDGLVLRARKNG